MTAYADLQARALEANLAIVEAGLVTLTFGNASCADRETGALAIKPSGVGYEHLRPESMVVLDIDSGRTLAGSGRPSSDTPTHLVLYRRFAEIGCMIHTHSRFAVAWAQACSEIPCLGTTHADHFRGPVPITRCLTAAEIAGAYEAATGEAIVEAVEQAGGDPLATPGALVRSHGPFAWGADSAQAVENAIALETIAEMAHHTTILAPATASIDDGLLARHHARKHGASAYYGQP